MHCHYCHDNGHLITECPGRRCHRCNGIGHKKSQCTVNFAASEGSSSSSSGYASGYYTTAVILPPLVPKLTPRECFSEAKVFIENNKCQQASEKVWFAASAALENLAIRAGPLVLPKHTAKNAFAVFVADQLPPNGSLDKAKFLRMYGLAQLCHHNYYANFMEGYVIDDYAKGVSLFVRLVDQIQHLKMDGLEQFLAKRELKINNGRIEPIPRPVPQQGLPHQ